MNNIHGPWTPHIHHTGVCIHKQLQEAQRKDKVSRSPREKAEGASWRERESGVPRTSLALSRCWSVRLSVSLSLTPPHTITSPKKGENGGWAEKRGDVMTRWLSHPSPLAPTSWPSHGCPAAWSASCPATTLPPRPASPPAAPGPHSAHSSGEPSRTLCSSSGPRLYSTGTVGLSASVLLICPSGH